jgi:hypothetical protein
MAFNNEQQKFQPYTMVASQTVGQNLKHQFSCVIFEVFTAVTMKNAVFWDALGFLQEPHCTTSQMTPFFIS